MCVGDSSTFWSSNGFADAEEHMVSFDLNLGNIEAALCYTERTLLKLFIIYRRPDES